jgi:transposase
MKIIGAMLEGERDPWALAALARPEVKATPENIVKSLEGNYYCSSRWPLLSLSPVARGTAVRAASGSLPRLSAEDRRLRPATAPRPGVVRVQRGYSSKTPRAAAGADLSSFPSEKQFASWLGLCPTHEQSGGKILNRRTRKVVNRAAVTFRNAAANLLRSQSFLGAQYRRLRTPLGVPKAITAMARKLACLFYRLSKHGQQYVDKGTEYYEARYRKPQIRSWPNGRKSLAFGWLFLGHVHRRARPLAIEAVAIDLDDGSECDRTVRAA